MLKRGFQVSLIDGGVVEEGISKEFSFTELKENLEDPWSFFLGSNLEGITPPNINSVFQYPPNRQYFDKDSSLISENFYGYTSMAIGGLGIGWGANCAEFDDDDLDDFLINEDDINPFYKKISKRIKISGNSSDDLSAYLGENTILNPPIDLSLHDQLILKKSKKYQKTLGKRGIIIGRSRMAVKTNNADSDSCTYCGRCLWGCEIGAIYNPMETIKECQTYSNFIHLNGWRVEDFELKERRIVGVNCISVKNFEKRQFSSENFILAAGAINSGKIYLKTIYKDPNYEKLKIGNRLETKSILDTKTIKIPYVLPQLIGKKIPKTYFQFNRLAMGLLNNQLQEYPKFVQGEILSLNSLLYHPLIESLPFGTKMSSSIFSLLHASLGVVTLFCPDIPSKNKKLRMSSEKFSIIYKETESQKNFAKLITDRVYSALNRIGLIAPKFQVLNMPPGSGLHYAGTIPMSSDNDPLCVNKDCRSYAYDNLFVVDSSIFPALPSKSLTYTSMANSIRVCEKIQ